MRQRYPDDLVYDQHMRMMGMLNVYQVQHDQIKCKRYRQQLDCNLRSIYITFTSDILSTRANHNAYRVTERQTKDGRAEVDNVAYAQGHIPFDAITTRRRDTSSREARSTAVLASQGSTTRYRRQTVMIPQSRVDTL